MDKRCLRAVAVLAGVLTLGVTSVAQAQHWNPQRTQHRNPHFGHNHGRQPIVHQSCSHGPQAQPHVGHCNAMTCTETCAGASYLFDKGFRAGRAAGWREGRNDGLYGHVFCDVPGVKVRQMPYHFRKGYKAGFRQGYSSGYAQGKSERYQRYRCRWW